MGEVIPFPCRDLPDMTNAEYLALIFQKQREAEEDARRQRGFCHGD